MISETLLFFLVRDNSLTLLYINLRETNAVVKCVMSWLSILPDHLNGVEVWLIRLFVRCLAPFA